MTNIADAMNAIDQLLIEMDRREPSDWYSPDTGPDMLHVPTVRAVLDASLPIKVTASPEVGAERGRYIAAIEALLPPDPLTERAKQLHAAAYSAHFQKPTPEALLYSFGDWDKLSDAFRKFWIAMARIDGERERQDDGDRIADMGVDAAVEDRD